MNQPTGTGWFWPDEAAKILLLRSSSNALALSPPDTNFLLMGIFPGRERSPDCGGGGESALVNNKRATVFIQKTDGKHH
jgi:hypothetical protein